MTIRRTLALFVALLAVGAAGQDTSPLKSAKDKRSYALGMDLGHQFHSLGIEVDPAIFSQGLSDALAGGKTRLTQEEVRAAISEMQAEIRGKQAEARSKAMQEGKQAGEAFLADNKKKEGVVTLPSGLQYKIVKEGTGKKPSLEDTVVCQYRGTLIDGTEFDSSYKRGQPATFPVKGVIKGWTEALQLMPVGSTWMLYIPSELAYGEQGAGGTIGPNATLIFQVELVSIKDKP